ncbi:MAG: hypothetical protein PF961_17010 [Planctomycetota bacterium]|jgi:hypothetical protein|nr:hypothetical protein [Planctomycetota bacterium]
MALSQDLAAAIAKAKLTTSSAATKIGVTYPSLKSVLDGKSFPNARSLGKYAKFLRVAQSKLQASVEEEKDKAGRRPGRPAKAAGAKKTTKKAAPKKAAKKAGRPAKAAAPVKAVDKRVVRSLEASLKSIDQLRGKIEAALKNLG